MNKKIKDYIKSMAITDSKYLIYVSVNLVCLIGVAILVLVEAIMKSEKTGLITITLIFIMLLISLIYVKKHKDKVDVASSIMLYPLNLIILPFLFVFGEGGGISSAMPIWLLFGILFVIILLEGKNCLILLLLTCVMDIFVMLVTYLHPEITNYSVSTFYLYGDNMLGIVLVSLSLGLMLKYVKFIDTVQREILSENSDKIAAERNRAIKANVAKTNFLTNVSHDVRTPLTDILGMTAKAKANISDKDTVEKCLEKIVNYSMELLYLFDNTLDLAEIESGALRIKENRFYVQEMLDFIETNAKDNAVANNIDFTFNTIGAMDKFLVGDSAKLRQILLLILDNSFKYTRAGGKIEFTTQKDYTRTDGFFWYRFSIKDNGIGMDADFVENGLFEPYVRGKDDLVRNSQGSGIGMTIAKKLVEAMNGRIFVKSEKLLGTEVTVEIPFQRDILYGTNMEDNLFFKVSDVNVLVVDDDTISSEIINQMLLKIGAEVTIFNNAEEAIEELKSAKTEYKMAILDVVLPGMDGYAATRNIRNLDIDMISGMPIIGITANAYSLAEEKAILSGMNEYISKPVDVTEFYQKIYRYLGKYSV